MQACLPAARLTPCSVERNPVSSARWWLKPSPGVVKPRKILRQGKTQSLSLIVAHPSDGMSNNPTVLLCLVLKHYNV